MDRSVRPPEHSIRMFKMIMHMFSSVEIFPLFVTTLGFSSTFWWSTGLQEYAFGNIPLLIEHVYTVLLGQPCITHCSISRKLKEIRVKMSPHQLTLAMDAFKSYKCNGIGKWSNVHRGCILVSRK